MATRSGTGTSGSSRSGRKSGRSGAFPEPLEAVLCLKPKEALCFVRRPFGVRDRGADEKRLVGAGKFWHPQTVQEGVAAVLPTGHKRIAAGAVRAVAAVRRSKETVEERHDFQSVPLRKDPGHFASEILGERIE